MMISCVKWKHGNKETRDEKAFTAAAEHQAIGKNQQSMTSVTYCKMHPRKSSTSLRVIDESRPIEEHIQQTKWKQVTTEEIKENQHHTQRIK